MQLRFYGLFAAINCTDAKYVFGRTRVAAVVMRPIGAGFTVFAFKYFPTGRVVALKRPPDPGPFNRTLPAQVSVFFSANNHGGTSNILVQLMCNPNKDSTSYKGKT
tara:strand:- start:1645 stop:1962 length:318 start_codon:yes stop_codon:yes gene_type:complete